MKKRILLLALMVLFTVFVIKVTQAQAMAISPEALNQGSGPVLSTGTNTASKAPKGGGGIDSLSGSYVAFDPSVGGAAFYSPGQAQTFCFRAETYTNDWGYVYNLWLRFPADWTVTNVYVQGTPTCDSGTWGTFLWSFQTSPYEVDISHPRYQASTDHCTAYYCFEVTAGTGVPNALESWYWAGDNYGSPPYHPCSNDNYTPSGQLACDEAVQPQASIPPATYIWEKHIDGIPWYPGITITRQTSDTIMIQEVIQPNMIPPAGSMPFVPVNVEGQGRIASLTTSSPARSPGTPERSAHPEAILWDQPLSTVNQAAFVDQDFPDYPDFSSFLADDFINADGWQINTIFIPGDGWNGFSTLLNATSLTWQIYADAGGVPNGDPAGGGNPPVWTLTLAPTDPQVVISTGTPGGYPSNTTLNLTTPLNLPPGHWWLVFYPTMSLADGGQYGRQASDTTNGYTGQVINPGGAFGWGTTWVDWMVTGGQTQTDIAFRLEGDIILHNFAQIEFWDPTQLRLLDWAATGGMITVGLEHLTWEGEIMAPITLTKWFHVEPCTWTQTILWEELWVDGLEAEQRPVIINKLPPELWIDATGGGPVNSGQPASFTLSFGNTGGFENNVTIQNIFPPEAPFAGSDPPADWVDPDGLWAEWDVGDLPQGAQGSIDVTVMIQPDLPISTTIEVWDGIFNHVGELMDQVIISLHVEPPITWDKYIDGMPWTPGITITRQTSDTIVVEEVLHILPPLLPAAAAGTQPALDVTHVTSTRVPDTASGVQPPLQALPASQHKPLQASGLLYLTSLDIGNTTFAVYDPGADAWTTLTPYETGAQMAVSEDGKLYAYGYWSHMIDLYDPATDSWSPVMPAPPASSGQYGNLEITNAGEFLYTEYNTTSLWYTSGGVWNTLPLPFTTNAMGDYDPTTDQYVIGQAWTTNAHLIDVHTWAITDYASPIGNGEYARFSVVMGNRYYFEAGGSDIYSFDLSSPGDPPLDSGVAWGWYSSAAGDRSNQVIYNASIDSTGLVLFDPATNTLTPLTGYGSSQWHSSVAYVPFVQEPDFAQTEFWNPAHLRLLDWAATGGMVTVAPDHLVWEGEIEVPTTITLTKWFHVEPCTWTETVLWEELWLDGSELDERPVLINKLPPILAIGAQYDAPVYAGQEAYFTLVYENTGGYENNVMIRNDFPSEAPFAGSDPPPDRVDPGGLWAEWDVGDLPQGGMGSIDVTVMIQPGLTSPTIIEIWDGIFNHVGELADEVLIDFHVEPQADLGVIKEAPAEVFVGDTFTYTLTASNHGPDDASGVEVEDTLPAGVTFVSASPGCDEEAGVVTCTVGNLAAGDSVMLYIVVTAPDEAGDLINEVEVYGNEEDFNASNDTDSTTTVVLVLTDLGVIKDAPAEVFTGDTFTYTLLVSNDGPSDASGVEVVDTLPMSVTFVSASPGCDEEAGVVTCMVGDLDAGNSVMLYIVVTAPEDEVELINDAEVMGNEEDPNADNNMDSVTTSVVAPPEIDLGVVKEAPEEVYTGDTITYTLTVSNDGPDDASGVEVVDTLPDGVTFVSASAGCDEAAGVVTCMVGDLEAGDSITLIIVVTAPDTKGDIINEAEVMGNEEDLNPDNDMDSATTSVVERMHKFYLPIIFKPPSE